MNIASIFLHFAFAFLYFTRGIMYDDLYIHFILEVYFNIAPFVAGFSLLCLILNVVSILTSNSKDKAKPYTIWICVHSVLLVLNFHGYNHIDLTI